jgi:uncharacterized membrane protein HdeD (DUF308 family)
MVSKTASVADVGAVPWWLILVEGIVGLIFGIFFITAPGGTSVFAVTVLGFYFLVRGIIAIIQIFLPDRVTPWGWLLFLGILGALSIVIAVILFANVVGATLALPIVIGVFMIIGSIGALFFSFRVRSA